MKPQGRCITLGKPLLNLEQCGQKIALAITSAGRTTGQAFVLRVSYDDASSDFNHSMKETADNLTNMDTTIGGFCASAGIADPLEIDGRVNSHLEIPNRHLEAFEGGNHG